jgi:glycosyltransferase involved in cell wall biosynthesis
MRDAIRAVYGIDAEIVPPPHTIDPRARQIPVEWVQPGFLLCVARLLPYKNVDLVVEAMAHRPDDRLVVVGDGPDRQRLEALAPRNVHFAGVVTDASLRWLYANSRALVAASHEDFGLTPLEAATFGRPTVALRAGGYLDTIVEGETGVFFDDLTASSLLDALTQLDHTSFTTDVLEARAAAFSEAAFGRRLRSVVAEVAG